MDWDAVRTRLSRLAARANVPWLAPRPAPAPAPATGPLDGRVAFAIGSGRCGTHFLAKLLAEEPTVAAAHDRAPLLESFHRYCAWYDLPVDDDGFLHAMEQRIRVDLGRPRQLAFEASPQLALSIPALERRFAPRFVFLVRHPRDVVRSYLHKGWYREPFVQARPDLALGYQDTRKVEHFFGRIAPRGDAFAAWNADSRVGKLAWYWTALNQRVLDLSATIPAERWRMYRLEDFDHDRYREVAAFLGFTPTLSAASFDRIRTARPGKQVMPAHAWTDAEWQALERHTGALATRLGYSLSRR